MNKYNCLFEYFMNINAVRLFIHWVMTGFLMFSHVWSFYSLSVLLGMLLVG